MTEGKPQKWVVEIAEEMTAEEAISLGKAIGNAGHTGRFIAGDEAGLVIDGARWRNEQRRAKGGDTDGKSELDKAVLRR